MTLDQLAHSRFLVFYMPRTKEMPHEDQVITLAKKMLDAEVVNLNRVCQQLIIKGTQQ
jgi:hypothetical protein